MAKKAHGKRRKPASTEILYGTHSVKAVLMRRPKDVEQLVLAGKEEYHTELIELAQTRGIDVYLVTWPEFQKFGRFTKTDKHQGVAAKVRLRRIYSLADFDRLKSAHCITLLDQVSNPQNFATILRSAAFFRTDAVVFMTHRTATPTPEVVRFAVGGAEFLDLYCVTNLAQAIDQLREMGFIVLGLDERGKRTLAHIDVTEQIAFVVGAEGEGLRAKTKQHCTELVRIPGGCRGLESLNAGVAATIALYEFGRLRDT